MSRAGLSRVLIRLSPVYAVCGAAVVVSLLVVSARNGVFGFDFHGTIWRAGKDILDGRSPYPRADAATLARAGNPAVYPAWLLAAATPFALLPPTAGAALWDLLSVGALAAALRLVGVRDWRVFAVVFLSFPVLSSLKLGQLDAFLALGCALAWRWRRSTGARLAVCVGAVVAAKLFLWPLLIWLLATGRRGQALGAVAFGAALMALGWFVIGFSTLRSYPHLLSALADAFGTKGYSLMALGTRLGVATSISRLFPFAAALGLCLACVWAARRGRDADALIAAVAAGILGSPILWMHYLVILLVVMAAKMPRLSTAWALPVTLWVVPQEDPGGGVQFALGFCLVLLLVATAFLRSERSTAQPDLGRLTIAPVRGA